MASILTQLRDPSGFVTLWFRSQSLLGGVGRSAVTSEFRRLDQSQ